MKLKYYGTAAAEGFPGIFCECKACKRARELGGKNLRSRSQALVDGELLVDFPPDTLYHVYALGLPLHKIENVIITHAHADHLYATDFTQRKITYAYFDGREFPLNVYGSQPTLEKVSAVINDAGASGQNRWSLFEFAPYEEKQIGSHKVTPLRANHNHRLVPYIFDVEGSDGKRMLYGHDTGIFPQETWDYLEKNKPYYNLVSLDCTAGIMPMNYDNHMNLERCAEVKARLVEMGCADEKTVFVLHHFSHNGGAVYDELVLVAKEKGFTVSYDGLEIEF